MQSTGHSSIQLLSLTSTHGSAITYVTAVLSSLAERAAAQVLPSSITHGPPAEHSRQHPARCARLDALHEWRWTGEGGAVLAGVAGRGAGGGGRPGRGWGLRRPRRAPAGGR